MQSCDLATYLPKFVKEVTDSYGSLDRPLTVSDLRRGILEERILEISAWSNQRLDQFEAHAARFACDAPLTSVLESDLESESKQAADPLAACGNASPYAWT